MEKDVKTKNKNLKLILYLELTVSTVGDVIHTKSNAELDSKSKIKKTDNYGEALFNLFFVSGSFILFFSLIFMNIVSRKAWKI